MARDPQGAPLFVEGDYEAPPQTRLENGIMATGNVHLGDGCVVEGDLFGADGIRLGKDVTVEGNLYSHGPIRWGDGLKLSGAIYSKAPRPMEEALVRAGLAQTTERELPMLRTAIDDTLHLLLEIAWDGHLDGEPGYPDSWWGLEWDETIEIVERILGLVDEVYRGGQGAQTWDEDALFDVLLQKGMTGVVPLSITRTGRGKARLKVGRPERRYDPAAPLAGWPWPAVSLLNLVGYAANGGFRLVLNGSEDLLEPDADPATVDVTVEILEPEAAAR